MAAPIKKHADYFRHDADASNDEKLMYLESIFGLEGYAFYFKMLEILAKSDDFEVSLSPIKKPVLAKKLGINLQKLEEMIKESTRKEVAAFVIIDEKLFSPGLKKRLQTLIDKRNRDRQRANFARKEVIDDENNETDSEKEVIDDENAHKHKHKHKHKKSIRREEHKQSRAEFSPAKKNLDENGSLDGNASAANAVPLDNEFKCLCFTNRPLFETPKSALTDEYRIDKHIAHAITTRYPPIFLWQKMEHLEWAKIHKPELCKKNPRGYLLASIKNRYPPPAGYEEWRDAQLRERSKVV